MSAVANVDADSAELSLEDGVPRFSLHVIGRFIEVSHAWNMALFLLSEDVAVVVDDHGRVVQCLFHAFPLENRGDNDHVVSSCQLPQHLCGFAVDGLRELDPGVALAGAHEEGRSPDLLEAKHVHALERSQFDDLLYARHDRPLLLLNRLRCLKHNAVLHCAHLHRSPRPHLLLLTVYPVLLYLHVYLLRPFHCLRLQRHFGGQRTVKDLSHTIEKLPR